MSQIEGQLKKARKQGFRHLKSIELKGTQEEKLMYFKMRNRAGATINKWIDLFYVKRDPRHVYLEALDFDVPRLGELSGKQQKVLRMRWEEWQQLPPSKRAELSDIASEADEEMEAYFNRLPVVSDEITSDILHRRPEDGCALIQNLVLMKDVEQHQVDSILQSLVMCYREFFELWDSRIAGL